MDLPLLHATTPMLPRSQSMRILRRKNAAKLLDFEYMDSPSIQNDLLIDPSAVDDGPEGKFIEAAGSFSTFSGHGATQPGIPVRQTMRGGQNTAIFQHSPCAGTWPFLLSKATRSTTEKPNVRLTEELAVVPRELASERRDILGWLRGTGMA